MEPIMEVANIFAAHISTNSVDPINLDVNENPNMTYQYRWNGLPGRTKQGYVPDSKGTSYKAMKGSMKIFLHGGVEDSECSIIGVLSKGY